MNDLQLNRRNLLKSAGAVAASLVLLGSKALASSNSFRVSHSATEWKRLLGPERYHVLREAGTERPFTSPLLKGTFACVGCNQPLFSSATKFESGTGWPSFWKIMPGSAIELRDHSLGTERTEILCARCGGHLGHVFNDEPKPTGLRYCMNGLALVFRPA